jgi:tetratricopeptide (TPR) repeat protein
MPESSPIPKQSVGRTFHAALIVLGVAALFQILAVGWAFFSRFHYSAPGETVIAQRVAAPVGETKELKMTESFAPAEPAPVAVLPKPTPVQPATPAPVQNPVTTAQGRQGELAQQAKALRERGDMSTALTRLREAQALAPDSPFIISEMAVTYEKMGLKDKALEQWRRIYDMGETAGIYYAAADAKLKSVDVQQRPTADGSKKDADGFQPGSVLALTDISKVDSSDQPGKKFLIRIPLKARAAAQIDVHDVVVQVFFYDLIDGQSVVQTNANVTYRWDTAPVDWNNGDIEILQVEYAAASPNARDRVVENRSYFGYVVRVYYKGDLQDMRADPVKLLNQYPPPLTLPNEDSR